MDGWMDVALPRTGWRGAPDDPLWDGKGCGSPPCCELSYPPGVTAPWFCRQLPQTTTDDIEARICCDYAHDQDTPLEVVELYVRWSQKDSCCVNKDKLNKWLSLHVHVLKVLVFPLLH